MRGRKPTPTVLHELHGKPSKTKPPPLEPKPTLPSDVPPPPIHLRKDARAAWVTLSVELHRLGLLTSVDLGLLAAYVTAWGDYVAAERLISRNGLVIKQGKILARNPAVMVRNKAMDQMLRIGSEFGFSPASRPRLGRQAADQDHIPAPTPGAPVGAADLERFLAADPDRKH